MIPSDVEALARALALKWHGPDGDPVEKVSEAAALVKTLATLGWKVVPIGQPSA